MSTKLVVLLAGATGTTGRALANGLAKTGSFRLIALVRPSSVSKPATEQLRSKGIEIRLGDLNDSIDKLKEALLGVDVLINSLDVQAIPLQKPLLQAAKEAGVKRVIPSDWASPGARGVSELRDLKEDIHDFVRSLGIGHTFVDVGLWAQVSLPPPRNSKTLIAALLREAHGKGDKKSLLTNKNHIADYVARIITDERTLNRYVIVWEDEVTGQEAFDIGVRVSGDGEFMRANRVQVSKEELLQRIASARAIYQESPSYDNTVALFGSLYMYSVHILGESSLENAKALGALDVRELYPDIVPQKLEDYAREYYANEYIYGAD
ncbi:hypothetical protein CERSUDRAFT_133313 [Gelatoporia subvermispora B]|uniref:NmrA-like domain-containing protein n=1 Tax=Ceriporiopsis subvermispora (strain B) TaxID=914234 RepID=M2RIY8_CERS8|nr:hypothetical protein CERSUDRAFT_133313 [Gelatoporia subvermispora B]